jgi:hypothetical protein
MYKLYIFMILNPCLFYLNILDEFCYVVQALLFWWYPLLLMLPKIRVSTKKIVISLFSQRPIQHVNDNQCKIPCKRNT